MSRHENLTIVFTDIVGYTKLTSELPRAEMRRLMYLHDDTILPIVDAFGGRRVKSIGDAFLLSFRSPTDAVLCGMAIQDAIAEVRHQQPENECLHLRVAIASGDVRLERRDVFGDAVNLASRIESITPSGQVFLAEGVYLSMNRADAQAWEVSVETLQGLPTPVRIYAAKPLTNPPLVNGRVDHRMPFGGAHRLRKVRGGLSYQFHALLRSTWMTRSARASRKIFLGVAAAAGAGAAAVVLTVAITSLGGGELSPPIGSAGANRMPTNQIDERFQVPGTESGGLDQQLSQPPEARPVPDHFKVSVPSIVFDENGADWLQARYADMEAGRDGALKSKVAAGLVDDGQRASALLLSGHLALQRDDPAAALLEYETMMAVDPPDWVLADARLAENLVRLLGTAEAADAEVLLKRIGSDAMIAALSKRSGQAGAEGRHRAVALLDRMGRSDDVDWFGYAVEELATRERCEERLAAVNMLGALGDPAAIPHLEAARGTGLSGWAQNRCLRGEAQDWIDTLSASKATSAAG